MLSMRRSGDKSHRQALCSSKVVAAIRRYLCVGDEVKGIGTTAGLANLHAAIFRSICALLVAMMVMVAAVGLIVAMMVMNLFASVIGKHTENLHRMVHRTFVEPEPHECSDVNHQQQSSSCLAK